MRKIIGTLTVAAAVLPVAGALWAGPSEVDDDLMASRRVFPSIGPGLRAVRHSANGNYYLLAAPAVGGPICDPKGKQLSVIGAASVAPLPNKGERTPVAFGEDCDVDAQGNVYVADRG